MNPPPHTITQPCFDWAHLARLVHPMQVAIVEAFLWVGQPLSAKDFSQMFAGQIDRVATGTSYMSYHLRELAKAGVLEAAGTEPVRGAVRKFYRLATEEPACP